MIRCAEAEAETEAKAKAKGKKARAALAFQMKDSYSSSSSSTSSLDRPIIGYIIAKTCLTNLLLILCVAVKSFSLQIKVMT